MIACLSRERRTDGICEQVKVVAVDLAGRPEAEDAVTEALLLLRNLCASDEYRPFIVDDTLFAAVRDVYAAL
jgi:hypothetical protein